MWSPTHIQVTVLRARGLLTKGKNGTNNCFVTIGMGKEKFQTSVKDKAEQNVEWNEECELTIPERGNRAELCLTVMHRNNLGIDEFLGQITLPLNEMDVYDRPRTRWSKLESKPGKEKKKERGDLETRLCFTVKSGSLTDLAKKEKHKSSIGQLASSVGGSLLSIGTLEKRKGLKKFAKSLGSRMHISGKQKKGNKDNDTDSYTGSFASIDLPNGQQQQQQQQQQPQSKTFVGQSHGDADPGVISEDDDEFVFDNLSHKSSGSSLNINRMQHHPRVPSPLLSKEDIALRSKTLPPSKPPRVVSDHKLDEWEAKLYGKHLDIGSSDSLKRRSWDSSKQSVNTKDEQIASDVSSVEHAPVINIIKESSTAPTSPLLQDKDESHHHQQPIDIPKPLPRSNTLSCIAETASNENLEPRIEKPNKTVEKEKKRFTKLKYFRKDKHDSSSEDIVKKTKQFGERIIIGHENNFLKHSDLQAEIPKGLLKKYEGKSREELILLANGMENEAIVQRQRVKELEDYLDNLLLRVMETHPKILQNPYGRTKAAN